MRRCSWCSVLARQALRASRPLGSRAWSAAAGLARRRCHVGIVAQAVLGGITVLLDLHPATVAAHFLLSMAMIAVAYLLYRRAADSG